MAFFRNCAAAHMRQETGQRKRRATLSEQPWFLKAGEKLAYTIDKQARMDRSQEMPFLDSNPARHTQEIP